MLKQFEVKFARYCDSWRDIPERRITLVLYKVPGEWKEDVYKSLILLGFRRSKRSLNNRWVKWVSKEVK